MFNVGGTRPMVPPIPMKKDNEWNYIAPDYSKCKKLGAHYVTLPKMAFPSICTGQGRLEREVLNDTFKLIPPSIEVEKSTTYGNPKRSEFGEAVVKCEEERYRMDILIEGNKATKKLFKSLMKKLDEMKDREQPFTLDENLGGSCLPIYKTELAEIFSDSLETVIAGIRERPEDAIPMVLEKLQERKCGLRYLKERYLLIWHETMNQNYLQSLDVFGPTFKRKEEQDLRPKRFLTEIEVLLSESKKNLINHTGAGTSSSVSLKYSRNILDDAYQLLLYQIKKTRRSNSNGQKGQEDDRMALFLKDFMAFVFHHQVQEFGDDEERSDSDKASSEDETSETSDNELSGKVEHDESELSSPELIDISVETKPQQLDIMTANKSRRSETEQSDRDGGVVVVDDYVLFFVSKSWYCFLRLHHLLCERLHKILELANGLIDNELKHGTYDPSNPESVHAVYLELKEGKTLEEIKAYYPDFLRLVVDFMKGNIESENYEDALRRMFGSQLYVAYTLDNVISRAVRHLQALVSDPVNEECVKLFYEFVGNLDSSPQNRFGYEMEYKEKAEKLLENEFIKVVFFKKELLMTLELLDGKTTPLEHQAIEAMDE